MRLLGVKAPLCATMGPGTVQLGRLGISLAFIGPGPQAVSRSRKLPLCGCVGRPWAEDAGVHRSPPSTLEGPGGATLLLGVLGKERPECVGRGLSGAGRHRASGLWSLMGCWGHRGRGWGGVEGAMGSPSLEGALGGWPHHRLGLPSLPPLPRGVEG